MAPRSETDTQTQTIDPDTKIFDVGRKRPERQIVWTNVYFMVVLHLMALYGIYLTPGANPRTWLWTWLFHFLGVLGITCGAHRLWAHRSYKATWPLRLLLMLWDCIAGQNDIFEWARDHRVHHKYSETDADPHNAKRGFFFSHVGWLVVKKHPDVIKKGQQLDLSDLYKDKIVMFQRRYEEPNERFFFIIIIVIIGLLGPIVSGHCLPLVFGTCKTLALPPLHSPNPPRSDFPPAPKFVSRVSVRKINNESTRRKKS